ncbi:carbohydrate-binding module family 13 protein [Rhizophagus clarus]|uniref:Carbohydrate-binding module family 13 protein n=1 Tax=Rhizophagus clarus TaxID=94130 RepID=A0A8H3KZR3_9GLOM|nr:carbohydrate-binding module family 13 protein [Rhizophagus clarus]
MVENKFLSNLSQNLLEILDDEEYYDITIEVGNDPYNKNNNDGSLVHIKLSTISPEIFHILLGYIYGGKLSLEECDASDIIKILIAANELNLQELISHLESFLIENKKYWMEENFDLIYQTSFKNDSFLGLQKYCTDLISNEPIKLFNSLNFFLIPEKLLVTIIQNENLQMSEIQIWERVIEWGLAQNSGLPSNPTNFSKDDFNTLKNTLQQCIPFIKFYNITSREFLKKVLPYKKILPKLLYKDLLIYFLENDGEPVKEPVPIIIKETYLKDIDSKIITFQQAELITKWIDKITNELTASYEFKLLYRDSRDWTNGLFSRFKKFHEICRNQSHTVVIIKVKGSNEILGGYNPIEWKTDSSYGITKNSFIFSFSNDGIEDYILSHVKNEKKAIFNSSFHDIGPSFGDGDLYLYQNYPNKTGELRIRCKKNSYERQIKEIGESCFSEVEVFQIV